MATSSALPLARKASPTLSKETRITVLSALKNFYDEQIFALLVKDFYNSDLEVSLAAIGASASLGNEVAIPHLYRMLESGKPQQKLAAVQTLAAINAPSSIDQLAKYFTILPAVDIRREILRAINKISALHPKARELNRAVLVEPSAAREYYEISLGGLLESGDLEPVRIHLLRAAPEVQRAIFQRLLSAGSEEVGGFLEYFQDKTGQLDPNTLGCYLCAFELKIANPPANFVVDLLSGSDPRATTSFLISLANFNGRIPNPGRIFRLLLRLPYVDQDAETHTGTFIAKIVAEIRSHSPLLVNEFVFTTSANLEAVFAKVKKQHISLKGLKEREALLAVILAKLLEQYASAELLADVQSHFRGDGGYSPASLIARIKEALIAAPEDEQNRLAACLPLFTTTDRLVRLNVAQTLGRANRAAPALLRRLNRLIRVAGILEVRASAKKIMEVLSFAREERVGFLEESSVVTLCQLLNRPAIEQAKVVFASPAKYPHSLTGYIRGARYVPARIFVAALLRLLLQPDLPPRLRDLAIDSLKNMDLAEIKGLPAALIRAARLPGLDRARLQDLAAIIARYGDSGILQPLIELTGSGDQQLVELGIRSLRNLAQRERNLPLDVLTHRLYLLLEHKQKSVQVEALLTLIVLQDDYATQILDDYLHSEDEQAIVQILANLERPLSRDTVSFLLKLLPLPSAAVHRELRRVLPELCQGSGAEEMRVALVEALKGKDGAPVADCSLGSRLRLHRAGQAGLQVPPRERPGADRVLHRHGRLHRDQRAHGGLQPDQADRLLRGHRPVGHRLAARHPGQEDGRRPAGGVQASPERRRGLPADPEEDPGVQPVPHRRGEVQRAHRAEHRHGDPQGRRRVRGHGQRGRPDAELRQPGGHPAHPGHLRGDQGVRALHAPGRPAAQGQGRAGHRLLRGRGPDRRKPPAGRGPGAAARRQGFAHHGAAQRVHVRARLQGARGGRQARPGGQAGRQPAGPFQGLRQGRGGPLQGLPRGIRLQALPSR